MLPCVLPAHVSAVKRLLDKENQMDHKKLLIISISVSALCLSGAYALQLRWEGALLVAGCLGFSILFWRRACSWLPSALLLVYTAAAIGGILLGLQPGLLIAGMTAALGAWEAASFLQSAQGDHENESFQKMQKEHLQRLIQVMAVSLLIGFSGLFLRLQLPFAAVVLIVLAALMGLHQFRLLAQPA